MLLDCKHKLYYVLGFTFQVMISSCLLCSCIPSYDELYVAVEHGEIEEVEKLIERGFVLKESNKSGDLILVSIKNKDLNITKYLIEKGANVNIMYEGLPLGYYILREGNDNIFYEMIQNGLDVTYVDDKRGNLLNYAVRNSNINNMRLLVHNGIDLNIRDGEGHTPLSMAIFKGDIEKIKYLIENGADVNYRGYGDADIWTELAFYWEEGYLDIANIALKKGAIINTVDFYALHVAAITGNYLYLEWLLNHGADPNIPDDEGDLPEDVAWRYALNPEGPPDTIKVEKVFKIIDLILQYKETNSTNDTFGLQGTEENNKSRN